MLKAFAHICFIAGDLQKSIDFYEKLGCRHAFDFKDEGGRRYGVYLHAGGRSFIEIFEGEPKSAPEGLSYAHFCLEVDDVAESVEELRGKGVEATDAEMGSDGSWQAWIKDPDGNRIELHGYTKASAQMTSFS